MLKRILQQVVIYSKYVLEYNYMNHVSNDYY